MDDKPEQREIADDLEVEDLDVGEAEADTLRGGSGGDYSNGMQSGGLKHPH